MKSFLHGSPHLITKLSKGKSTSKFSKKLIWTFRKLSEVLGGGWATYGYFAPAGDYKAGILCVWGGGSFPDCAHIISTILRVQSKLQASLMRMVIFREGGWLLIRSLLAWSSRWLGKLSVRSLPKSHILLLLRLRSHLEESKAVCPSEHARVLKLVKRWSLSFSVLVVRSTFYGSISDRMHKSRHLRSWVKLWTLDGLGMKVASVASCGATFGRTIGSALLRFLLLSGLGFCISWQNQRNSWSDMRRPFGNCSTLHFGINTASFLTF